MSEELCRRLRKRIEPDRHLCCEAADAIDALERERDALREALLDTLAALERISTDPICRASDVARVALAAAHAALTSVPGPSSAAKEIADE